MLYIQKEPLWQAEAFYALDREPDTALERIISHPEKFHMTKEELEEMFAPYQAYRKAVLPGLSKLLRQNETLCFYLNEEEKTKSATETARNCYFLLQAAATVLTDLEDPEQPITCKGAEHQLFLISRIICWTLFSTLEETARKEEAAEQLPPVIASITDLMELLKKSSLSAEWKYRLMYLYLNQEKFLQEFQKTMKQMVRLLKKHFGLIQTQYERMQELTNEEALQKLLTEGNSGLKLSLTEEKETWLHLSIFHYNGIDFHEWIDQDKQENILVGIGMFVQKLVSGREENTLLERSEIQAVCKALGDTSRYRILDLILQNGKMYLQELSREIGLTPATVSHHLASLQEANLLQLELEEKEKRIIYYTVNREQLIRIGETFRQMAEDGAKSAPEPEL